MRSREWPRCMCPAGTMRMWVPPAMLAGTEHAPAGTAWVQTLLN
jgi:hypothetical protein